MAGFDAFLKIDGIAGESGDAKHKDEIEIVSFHWGITRRPRGGARVEDFQVVKYVDAASPLLFDAVCSGQHIKQAVFSLRKTGGAPLEFYKITFEDCQVASVTPAGNANGDTLPMEQVRLDFGSAEIEYRSQDPKGGAGDVVRSSCTPARGRGDSE